MEEYPMEMQFPVILDGATGTELQKRGFTGDMSAEQWVLEHPESILEIQRKYVASGSTRRRSAATARSSKSAASSTARRR